MSCRYTGEALFCGVVVVLGVLLSSQAHAAASLTESVVRIKVSRQRVDPGSPWQGEDIKTGKYLALVRSDRRLLTTAYAIRDAKLIEMMPFGAVRRYEMEVAFADYEANLALLKPVDENKGKWPDLEPLPLGDDLALNGEATVYKRRDASQLSQIPATLQEVEIYPPATSQYGLPMALFKVQQSDLGWSEPVVDEKGRLVALTSGQDNDFVHALPVSLVKHFLEDDLGDGYRGFPEVGIHLDPLESPAMRARLGVKDAEGGIRIAKVVAGSSFQELLREDDVLVKLGGHDVSAHGYISHPLWGDVHLKALVASRYGGGEIALRIVRDGKRQTVKGTLQRFDSNRRPVVAYRYDQPRPYFIFGGLIFQELSLDYLKQWGKRWKRRAPSDLVYTWKHENERRENPSERIVILGRFLSDKFNRGYSDADHELVRSVNGRPVRSLKEAREALRESPVKREGRRFVRIQLMRGAGEVILAYDGLSKAHKRIRKTYAIPESAQFFEWTGR